MQKKSLGSCGVLIESPEIHSLLTAREALCMFAEIKGIPKTELARSVEEIAVQVRMVEWLDKKFGSFSKGMKQRINIAAALLKDPDTRS
ncbi:MAG: ATP-binding cassette domain-containing protein [Nitrososphaerales archaeon]